MAFPTLLLTFAVPAIGMPLSSVAAATTGTETAVFAAVHPASRSQLARDAADLSRRAASLGLPATTEVNGQEITLRMPASGVSARFVKEVGGADDVYFRHTLCYAPPYTKHAQLNLNANGSAPELPTSCTPSTQLAVTNLKGVRYTVATTSALAAYPSTSPTTKNYRTETVLLPGIAAKTNGVRYLLGPAEMTEAAVRKAAAHKTQLGRWVVNMTLTPAGTASWNALAKKYFHQVLGIELNGVVYSAPLTEPNTATFKTFAGHIQISGSFTKSEAEALAQSLSWGGLAVPLKELSVHS
jgi:hypothetical protein